MGVSEHAAKFAGRQVREYDPDRGLGKAAADNAWKLRVDYDAPEPLTNLLAHLLKDPEASRIPALVIGSWGDSVTDGEEASRQIVETLAAARGRLPALTGIFLGDITYEECEISWINQTDVSSLFTAYPKLEHFRVRGGNGLTLGSLRHAALRSLAVETGGLSGAIARQIASAKLPALVHLELWLGESNYGADWTLEDLQPLFTGRSFPRLEYLGLCNSEQSDALAIVMAKSPLLARLKTLDLSLGTLSDRGAEALLAAPALKNLAKLDLHHHYLSNAMMKKLAGLGLTVDLDEQEKGDEDDRYVAHGE